MTKKTILLTILLFAASQASAVIGDVNTKNCYDDDRYYINPEIALCTTHAYNLGWGVNPTNAADQEAMARVVALKANIITQQMKKQYDYMDATMKRFRTLLEKSVMLARLEAAGGTSNKQTGGGATNANNKGLPGAKDCGWETGTMDRLRCLQENYRLMVSTSNSGTNNSGQLRQQMEMDAKALDGTTGSTDKVGDVCNSSKTTGRNELQACLQKLNSIIGIKIEAYNKANKSSGLSLLIGDK